MIPTNLTASVVRPGDIVLLACRGPVTEDEAQQTIKMMAAEGIKAVLITDCEIVGSRTSSEVQP